LWGGGTKYMAGHLMNANNMGKFNAAADSCLQTFSITASNPVGQEPVAWDGGTLNGKNIFVWPTGNNILQFQYNPATLTAAIVGTQTITAGGNLVASANGTLAGILWGVSFNQVFYAFLAEDISQILWSSEINSARDALPAIPGHFQFATSANAKVYVPTSAAQVVVYGMLITTETTLKFLTQPISALSGLTTLQLNDPLAALEVAVVDVNGVIVPSGYSITLTFGPGFVIPPILKGVTTQPCINGIATFTGLSVGTSGVFQLIASAAPLIPVLSNQFAVISPGVIPQNTQSSSAALQNAISGGAVPTVNPMIAGIAGGVAAFVCLVAVAVAGVIFYKEKQKRNEDKNYVYNPSISLESPSDKIGRPIPTMALSDIQSYRMDTVRE